MSMSAPPSRSTVVDDEVGPERAAPATSEPADEPAAPADPAPTPAEIQARLDEARRSLEGRLDELGRRAAKVRRAVNAGAMLRRHPLATVAIGLGVGVMLGWRRRGGRAPAPRARRPRWAQAPAPSAAPSALRSFAMAAASAVARRVLAEAMVQLAQRALAARPSQPRSR
ncbi:MAG: hypothetical protein R2939_02890 [Kofleriaceae bacterium]